MSEFKFIANMNISPLTVEDLQQKGWDVLRVSEVMDVRSKDTTILDYARKHHRILITQDTDFSALLAIGGHKEPSVINLRVENGRPGFITMRIIEVISKMRD